MTYALACPTPMQDCTRLVGSPGVLIPGHITSRPFEKLGTFGTLKIAEYSTIEALDGGGVTVYAGPKNNPETPAYCAHTYLARARIIIFTIIAIRTV
jgi:hypothetical protein